MPDETPNQEEPPEEPWPWVPEEAIRRQAHLSDAASLVSSQAAHDYNAANPQAEAVDSAKRLLSRAPGRQQRLTEERDALKARRAKHPRLNDRRTGRLTDVCVTSNLPAASGAAVFFALGLIGLGCEVSSGMLMMDNSGWGLTESLVVMVTLVWSFTLQPFTVSKMLAWLLTPAHARWFNLAVGGVGFPFGFWGFWVFASTLGALADAPAYSMFDAPVEDATPGPSKTRYMFNQMISLWFGSYSSFWVFGHLLGKVWPETAEPNSAYAAYTAAIEELDEQIAAGDDAQAEAAALIERDDARRAAYVNACKQRLAEAQEELANRRRQVRLSPYEMVPSNN